MRRMTPLLLALFALPIFLGTAKTSQAQISSENPLNIETVGTKYRTVRPIGPTVLKFLIYCETLLVFPIPVCRMLVVLPPVAWLNVAMLSEPFW